MGPEVSTGDMSSTVQDASGYRGVADAFFRPQNEDEILALIHRATRERVPLTISGARSGLTGGCVPQGGWLVSMDSFRHLEVAPDTARSGAAVLLAELHTAAARTGRFYAPDPTEIGASLGGTIATNASGSRSFRYGSTRQHVLALRAAFMDGTVREFQRGDKIGFDVSPVSWPNTRKCTAGYPLTSGMDMIDLLCGSEGTLAIVLEATVRLLPVPQELFTAVVFFDSDERTLDAVDEWRTVPGLRMLEYVNRDALHLIHPRFPDLPKNARAALLIEAEGDVDIDDWEKRLSAAGALVDDSWFAVSAADRERFRKLRHTLPEMVNATVLSRGFMKMGTDYAVPVSRNREMLTYYRQRLDSELPGKSVIYGHIGDAHLHVQMLPATKDEAQTASRLLTEFAAHAVSLGGTVSAEHGLGKRKAHLLALQHSPESIESMKAVKRRLDPLWLLGRDTLFPAPPLKNTD